MKARLSKEISLNLPKKGFALVVTLTLMILLSILALGLLSLSTVSIRTLSTSAPRQIAEANARLALMLAIGDLQKNAGLDTRITARADILDEKNPPILGVWKSWEGTDHDSTGRPISPGNYKTAKTDRFIAWLYSGDQSQIPNTSAGSNKITLVGKNSVGDSADQQKLQIHLDPIPVDKVGKNGAYAWWIGGENMKARLPVANEPDSGSAGQWAVHMKSHSTVDPKPFGIEAVLNDPKSAEKVSTRKQIDLISGATGDAVSKEFFHDLSATSVGLLTNAATGGWKKDLSLFTENASIGGNRGPIDSRNLPLFRLKPDVDSFTSLATSGSNNGSKSVLYPWSDYRGSTSSIPIYQHPAVASWNNLIDYSLLYKEVNGNGSSIRPRSTSIGGNSYEFLHKVRIIPIIARVQWVYSYGAGTAAGADPTAVNPRMILTPVVTMWNPYNVSLNSTQLEFYLGKALPTAIKFTVGGQTYNTYFTMLAGGGSNYPNSLTLAENATFRTNGGFSLLPGETKVFSPTSNTAIDGSAKNAQAISLSPGYRSGGGHFYNIKDDTGAPIVVPQTATMKAEVKFDVTFQDGPSSNKQAGVGIYLDMRIGGQNHLAYRMIYKPEVAAEVYKPISDFSTSNQLSNLRNNPQPFLTTIFGARMASKSHLPAKGFIQSSPLVNYTAMGAKDITESTIGRPYRGTSHPVNSPFDYSFEKLTNASEYLPNSDPSNNRGYIVTGFTSGQGLNRCVLAEIPTRPLQSLAELQHWDLRYENPIPPYGLNLVGNATATPLIASNSALGEYKDAVDLQHDDSYCANHVLFDDWFFSSIAPDPSNFGNSGRDLQTVYKDFISGAKKLPNTAYRPISGDGGANASTLYADQVNTKDSWKTIASRLEVEGMFNVNSTSYTAWRALLGHARGQKIPYLSNSGGGMSVSLSGETDYATSRFSIAGDSDTGSNGSSGDFPGATQFTGYRIFDDKMIDSLAQRVVEQVRLRGPFLSLSEFVNRQLSTGAVSLQGTLQAALQQMGGGGASSPYSEMVSIARRFGREQATSDPPGDDGYLFRAAANGESIFGLPGWTRQADILRPIAPILTVRDDTFTVRAYGDARDKTGKILATVVCEAVVVRTRDYVDPVDVADLATYPTAADNRLFGRRFQIRSFRWLAPEEI